MRKPAICSTATRAWAVTLAEGGQHSDACVTVSWLQGWSVAGDNFHQKCIFWVLTQELSFERNYRKIMQQTADNTTPLLLKVTNISWSHCVGNCVPSLFDFFYNFVNLIRYVVSLCRKIYLILNNVSDTRQPRAPTTHSYWPAPPHSTPQSTGAGDKEI